MNKPKKANDRLFFFYGDITLDIFFFPLYIFYFTCGIALKGKLYNHTRCGFSFTQNDKRRW
nr:MAG TPA: hypothetical protein [Caudoviricetes sp.]